MAMATEREEVCRRLFLLADNDSDGFIWRWVPLLIIKRIMRMMTMMVFAANDSDGSFGNGKFLITID